MLLFGAVASVWGYNRVGDVLVAISRAVFLSPAIHYVDDYGGIEPHDTALSAFWCFRLMNEVLGLNCKTNKQQPPATMHSIQGTLISLEQENIVVRPTPSRIDKITAEARMILETNTLVPDRAAELAGKAQFVTTTIFGKNREGCDETHLLQTI